MHRNALVVSIAWIAIGCGGGDDRPSAEAGKPRRPQAPPAPLWASCQTTDNQRCNEWAGVHWQLAGADDAQREAATRNTCENYTRGVYRPGERCRRVGTVGACVHRENVAFAYSDRAAAVRRCNQTDGGVVVGTWHDAAEAATF